jgi:putative PIN family toxin of toxin-antitoxin system
MSFVVIDANVLVSAAISPTGIPGAVVERCRRHFVIAHTAESFVEYRRILLAEKFDPLLSRRERARAIGAIRKSSQFFRIDSGPPISRDPKDDAYLAFGGRRFRHSHRHRRPRPSRARRLRRHTHPLAKRLPSRRKID